jgi:TonB family protein
MKKGLMFILFLGFVGLSWAQDEVFTIVEQIPIFGECSEHITNETFKSYHKEVSKCSARNIQEFLANATSKIRADYTEDYLNAKVRFIVEIDGSLSNQKIIYSSGNTVFDKACIEIVSQMQDWRAGSQRGNAVRVQYTFPIILK